MTKHDNQQKSLPMNKFFYKAVLLTILVIYLTLSNNAFTQQQNIIVRTVSTYDFQFHDSILNNQVITIFDTDTTRRSEMGYIGQTQKNSKKDYKYDSQGRLIRLSSYKAQAEGTGNLSWSWVPEMVEEFGYDTYGNMNNYVQYLWSGEMVPQIKRSMEYDLEGHRTLLVRYFWRTELNDWLPFDKTESSYNEEGYETLHIRYLWDADHSEWVFNYKIEQSFNEAGRNTESISYKWDTTSGQWIYNMKIDSIFNDQGKILTTLLFALNNDSSDWRPFAKYEFTYDTMGYTSSRIYYIWNSDASSWVNLNKDEYTHDSKGNVLYYAYYKWITDSTKWQKRKYESYEYDPDGMTILKDSFELVLYENSWRGFRHTYAYNDNQQLALFQTYNWNSSDSTFTDYERISYTYDESGMIKTKFTDRYGIYGINDYLPYEHIFYTTSPEVMDIRNTCVGDSILWYDKYYREGIYREIIPSAEDNDSVGYLSVTEFPRPGAPQITGDTAVNPTDLFLYSAAPDSGYTYEWMVENGIILSGQGQDSVLVQWDSTATGSIKVLATTGGGCHSDTVTLTVNISLTKVTDPLQPDISVFPNPVKFQLHIKNLQAACNYRIIDLSGRVLQAGKLPVDGIISVTALPPGTYYLKLMDDRKRILNKMFMKL